MKILDPGHAYALDWLDGKPPLEDNSLDDWDFITNVLVFVKREGEGFPGNEGHHAGTNIQEVLRALIDRVKYLDNQILDWRNEHIIAHLRDAIYLLEQRAADRHNRNLSCRTDIIETYPTCSKCGHIGCSGECHT